MLEALTFRVTSEIPHAVNSPINPYHAYYYWSRQIEGFTDIADFEQTERNYQAASIRFTYEEIDKFSEDEFLDLQTELQVRIFAALTKNGAAIPTDIVTHLVPGDKKNVLVHEREHLAELPDHLRKNSIMDIVILTEPSGGIQLDGVAYYDLNAATDYEMALAASAPQSLSIVDIESARRYAGITSDQDFIDLVEQRIAEREQH